MHEHACGERTINADAPLQTSDELRICELRNFGEHDASVFHWTPSNEQNTHNTWFFELSAHRRSCETRSGQQKKQTHTREATRSDVASLGARFSVSRTRARWLPLKAPRQIDSRTNIVCRLLVPFITFELVSQRAVRVILGLVLDQRVVMPLALESRVSSLALESRLALALASRSR